MGLDQPRDEKGQFATTGSDQGLSKWASQKSEVESPAKVIAKAWSAPHDMSSFLAAQGKGQTDTSAKGQMDHAKDAVANPYVASGEIDPGEMGMDPMVIPQYRAADATAAYFNADPKRLARVKDYTAVGNKDVNAYLRDPAAFRAAKVGIFTSKDGIKYGNDQADEVAERAKLFTEDLKNAPKAPGDVLRGTKMPKELVDKLQVGKVFEARGNLSTTSDKVTARGFSYTGNDDKRAQFMLHITQKSGVFVGGVSSEQGEMETVVPHGTRFRIDKVEKESRPRWVGSKESSAVHHLYMTEIDK